MAVTSRSRDAPLGKSVAARIRRLIPLLTSSRAFAVRKARRLRSPVAAPQRSRRCLGLVLGP